MLQLSSGVECKDSMWAFQTDGEVHCIGDVPYIICLDRPSRSLVLSIRGTQSLADAATDLLAHPLPLHHWLPNGSWQVFVPSHPAPPATCPSPAVQAAPKIKWMRNICSSGICVVNISEPVQGARMRAAAACANSSGSHAAIH